MIKRELEVVRDRVKDRNIEMEGPIYDKNVMIICFSAMRYPACRDTVDWL